MLKCEKYYLHLIKQVFFEKKLTDIDSSRAYLAQEKIKNPTEAGL